MKRVWMRLKEKLKEKETLKLLGMLLAFCFFIWFNIVSVAGISGYHEYIDIPTLGSMVLFAIVALWLSGTGKDFLNGLQLAFSNKNDYSRIKLQRACNAVKYTRTLILLEAGVEICICIIDTLFWLDPKKYEFNVVSIAFAITLLSILYAFIIAVLLTLFIAKLDNMLASYMEEPQAEITVEEAQTIYFKLRSLGLTDREAEVARLVSCEMTHREIGQMLYISDATVKKHVTHILEKTALTDREELTKMIKNL